VTQKEYAESLRLAGYVTEPAIRQAIRGLPVNPGSRGLDAGCGNALRTVLLADKVGTAGLLVGLDKSPDNLVAARNVINENTLSPSITLVQGDILELPFRDGSFDWVWCSDTMWPGHVVEDPVAGVAGLARVLRPGGIVALVYWSSQVLLPGHPALEARLNKAFAETTRYLGGITPQQHFLRAAGWLDAAGLAQITADTYLSEIKVPLSEETRQSVAYCFEMFWENLKPHLSGEDWKEYQRLCKPESPDFILNRSDYYGFLTYSMFCGKVT